MPSTTLRIWSGRSTAGLGFPLGVNAGLLVAEVIGGFVLGSLALIADAAHLATDARRVPGSISGVRVRV